MAQKTSATAHRSAQTGKFTVRSESGKVSKHSAGKKTPKAVSSSIDKNKDALKRLANR